MPIQLILKLRKNRYLRFLFLLCFISIVQFSYSQIAVEDFINLPCDTTLTKLKYLSNEDSEQIIPELRSVLRAKRKWHCLYNLNYNRLVDISQGMMYEEMNDYINIHLDAVYLKALDQLESSQKLVFEINHSLLLVDAMDKSDEQISNMESSLLRIIQKLDSIEHKSDKLMHKYVMAYNGLCFLYKKQGRYHEGLDAAQYIIHTLTKRFGADGQVKMYGNMNTLAGTFAMYIGELDIAENNIQKALAFFKRLNQQAEQKGEAYKHHPSLRNLYVQLAQIKLKQNNSEEFLRLLNTAENHQTDYPLSKIEPTILRGKYFQANSAFTDAVTQYEKAVRYIELDTTMFITTANLYNSLGECFYMQKDTSEAITHYNTAIRFVSKNDAGNLFATEANTESIRSFRNLARLYLRNKELNKAYSYGKKLIKELQLLRSNQFFLLDKIKLLEDTYDDYGILLQILYEQGNARDAYVIMQQGKAQLIKEGKIKSLYQKQAARGDNAEINDIQSQLLAESVSEENSDSLRNELYKQKEKLKTLQSDKIKESLYTALQSDLRPLADLLDQLQDDEVILEYYIGNENAFSLELSKTSLQLHQLVHPDSINQLSDEFSNRLIHKENLMQSTEALSKYLLPNSLHTGYNRFVIIPDGILHYIPFEFLNHNETKLINHASVSYLLYNDMHQSSKPQSIVANDILLLAPSFVTGEFENLNHSRSEVMKIQQLTNGKLSIGEQASKSFFVNEGPHHKILHLSTHAKINESASEQSFIAFNDSDVNHKLFLHQIEQLGLQSELVVLSACETGIGKLLSGEGMFSMKKAFFQAGSKSVLSSLWPSNDQTTAEIMSYFYEHLLEGKTKDEALRQAKLTYLKLADPAYTHPFYWAGFIAVGDMSELSISDGFDLKYILIVGFLLLSILFFLVRRRRHKAISFY